jgi:hypothetical protein
MAFCKTCGQEFLTRPEEERLMVTGVIEQVCMACAMVGSNMNEEDPAKIPLPPMWPRRKFRNGTIIRVDLRNEAKEVMSFIALEPGPYFPKYRERKRPVHRPKVQILGNPNSTNEPAYVSIITNIINFEREDRDLFAMKVPSSWDPRSGIGEIRIARNLVTKVEHAENGVLATLKDGGSVAGYYAVGGEFKYLAFS